MNAQPKKIFDSRGRLIREEFSSPRSSGYTIYNPATGHKVYIDFTTDVGDMVCYAKTDCNDRGLSIREEQGMDDEVNYITFTAYDKQDKMASMTKVFYTDGHPHRLEIWEMDARMRDLTRTTRIERMGGRWKKDTFEDNTELIASTKIIGDPQYLDTLVAHLEAEVSLQKKRELPSAFLRKLLSKGRAK